MIVMAVSGTLTLDGIYRLDRAFWAAWDHHTRILMDYTAIDDVAVSVAEFTKAGVASQAGLEPQGSRIKAVYVATDPNVYAFTRVIEGVWGSFLDITTRRSIDDALAWLGYEPGSLADLGIVATG